MEGHLGSARKSVESVRRLPERPPIRIDERIWSPCSGIDAPSSGYNIPAGHVGHIIIAISGSKGKPAWSTTGRWETWTTALQKNEGITISPSLGRCPSCRELWARLDQSS